MKNENQYIVAVVAIPARIPHPKFSRVYQFIRMTKIKAGAKLLQVQLCSWILFTDMFLLLFVFLTRETLLMTIECI